MALCFLCLCCTALHHPITPPQKGKQKEGSTPRASCRRKRPWLVLRSLPHSLTRVENDAPEPWGPLGRTSSDKGKYPDFWVRQAQARGWHSALSVSAVLNCITRSLPRRKGSRRRRNSQGQAAAASCPEVLRSLPRSLTRVEKRRL